MTIQKKEVTVNGRTYQWPSRPVVAVCVDGSQPEYIEEAIKAGVMPWAEKVITEQGSDLRCDCVVPSFTNPNNISIVTGVPPVIHGICGNFYYDRENDCEVMMNDPRLLRTDTIFKAFQDAGAKIAVITAKDKLRRLLGNGLAYGKDGAICFSSEKADLATYEEHGIEGILEMVGMEVPSVYSGELSEFIFAAGVKLMESADRPDIMYLSTTDYIQHKFAPGTDGANKFYAMMDKYWAQLDELGAIVALTADHGMNAKHDTDGNPDVIYLQSLLDSKFGVDSTRVILPITDPYVVHHGALGSFATVYLPEEMRQTVMNYLLDVPGLEAVLTNAEGCDRFGLASDRTGDIIIVSEQQKALGTTEIRHDLSGLEVPLRSHGGTTEQCVPLIVSRPVTNLASNRRLRNFDIYDVALNHTET
jgi:phosphonoacetate hydrolase